MRLFNHQSYTIWAKLASNESQAQNLALIQLF